MVGGTDSSVTVIGDSMQVRGNLTGDEDLHVMGRIEGSIDLQRTLIVAESGIVKAEVQVRNAIISGVVVGNVSASESVELTREGRMVGDISAPRVIIVDGASFRGNVDMGDIENMPARKPREERARPAPARVERKAEPKKVEPEMDETIEDTVEEAKPEPKKAEPKKARVAVKPKAEAKKEPAKKAKKRPSFLKEPPKAKGLPKKKAKKSRVVVKRR
jgi:cytoskeletal protein CcmA (bactofilin family)